MNKFVAIMKSPATWCVIALVGIFLGLALFPLPAHAGTVMEAHQGGDSLLLLDAPCTNAKVLEHAADLDVSKLRAAQASLGGVTYEGCWQGFDDAVGVVYEDGDRGLIPMQFFEKN